MLSGGAANGSPVPTPFVGDAPRLMGFLLRAEPPPTRANVSEIAFATASSMFGCGGQEAGAGAGATGGAATIFIELELDPCANEDDDPRGASLEDDPSNPSSGRANSRHTGIKYNTTTTPISIPNSNVTLSILLPPPIKIEGTTPRALLAPSQ